MDLYLYDRIFDGSITGMSTPKRNNVAYTKYIVGFVGSLMLTVAAYMLVSERYFSSDATMSAIIVLALLQFALQARLFLHVGEENRPMLMSKTFGFMVVIVTMLVAGTLWIMANLDYNMMSPSQTDTYLMEDEGLTP